jgi:hypothetical protein
MRRLIAGVVLMNLYDPAALAARTAYIKALTVGASAHIAFDVACAAYRATWPGLEDCELRNVVARALALLARDRAGVAERV